ncbi:type II secretion system F family protein [Thermoflexus sp.]|uniref:type II secretion system F family protein n=1 Tax=Thermoflexus sp. TaxID=1969742 RepID=UPI0025EF8AF0|nr:type II secretion system F family protein [Thermoflexus sp.]MDW8180465.1 type II secretion system F family protein [Anaerolineae bacterium]MCS6963846.1 type II secretion system F family protein [Thermoflexus sp.]MCS7351013.1 type II secretion system F family protein [Thermoflexus sp.]MCX7691250.1 type II secretion system F family protein [Thermoflexus sp.]MDW8184803.1 type II secretion system F family protein [Anaerolineae bacterium]
MVVVFACMALLAIALIGAAVWTWSLPSETRLRLERAYAAAVEGPSLGERIQRWSLQLAHQVPAFWSLLGRERLARSLAQAGYPFGLTVEAFYGMHMLGGIAGAGLGVLLYLLDLFLGFGGCMLILAVLSAAGGFLGPTFWMNRLIERRQRQIGLAVPDFLDTLAVLLEAGLSFDTALQQLAGRMQNPLGEELRRLLQELAMGVPRVEAYRRLMERNTAPELLVWVEAMLQAERLGQPLTPTVSRLAADMRARRIQKARERVGRVGPIASMLVALIIGPAVMCMLTGGLVLQLLSRGLFPR